jgi:predicted RNase H-like HicB family nuclease
MPNIHAARQAAFAAHTAAKADGATDAEARQAAEEAWDAVMEEVLQRGFRLCPTPSAHTN